jgi:hypothetical protein
MRILRAKSHIDVHSGQTLELERSGGDGRGPIAPRDQSLSDQMASGT